MFGFSFGEIVVISIVALLVLGPDRIPQVARSLGRLLAELRRATDEVKREFNYNEFTKDNQSVNYRLPVSSILRASPLGSEKPGDGQQSIEVEATNVSVINDQNDHHKPETHKE